jgi:hypothetical protein
MNLDTEENEDIAIEGFRLAIKLSKICANNPAYVVMFALAILTAAGFKRRHEASLQDVMLLHNQTITAILAGLYEKQRKKAAKEESVSC